MRWPFKRKVQERMSPLPTVSLTDEEHQECQAFVTSMLPQGDNGHWVVKEELIEPLKRSLVAMCMMGRAERFAALADSGGSEYRRQACEAAAKACSIYPLSTNFYDFACVLVACGDDAAARTMFAEFIRRHNADSCSEVDRIALSQRDLVAMVRHASERLRS